MKAKISRMKLSDLHDCAAIAAKIPGNCWGKAEIRKHIKQKNCEIYVIKLCYEIIGFVCLELKKNCCQIWIMAISNRYCRQGYGKLLIDEIKNIFPSCKLVFHVRESNLPTHLFLQKNSFYCSSIFRNYFIDRTESGYKSEDSYCFEYDKNNKDRNEVVIVSKNGNVIAKLLSTKEELRQSCLEKT